MYFDSSKFLKQVEKAINIFSISTLIIQPYLFLIMPVLIANAVMTAKKMNVNPCGKQPVMRDTVWNGAVQKLVGIPKGLKIVLEERGVITDGLNAKAMRDTLGKHPDFTTQTTLVEELITSRSHICLFFPKFHCELNAIEHVWCHGKNYARMYVNGSIVRLRIVPESLNTCDSELIGKFFETCREYLIAYYGGCTCVNVDVQVKLYRRVTETA